MKQITSWKNAVTIMACVVAGMVVLAEKPAQADIIANYTFGTGTSTSRSSFDTDPNSTALSFTHGPGLSAGSNVNISTTGGNPTPHMYVRAVATAGSESGAVANNDFFSFRVAPHAGYELDLTNLTFQTFANREFGAADFDAYYFVRSSIDGYTSTIGGQPIRHEDVPIAANANGATWVNRTVDLSGLEFQNLSAETEFHLYLYGRNVDADNQDIGPSSGGNQVMRFDNVVLNATVVPTPEPGTWAMMGIGLLGMIVVGRKKKLSAKAVE